MVEGNDHLASECLGHEVHQRKDGSRHLTAQDIEDKVKTHYIKLQRRRNNHYMKKQSSTAPFYKLGGLKLELERPAKKSNILTAVHRKLGEYCSSLDTRSTASGGMRL